MKYQNTLAISALAMASAFAGSGTANVSTGSLIHDVQIAVGATKGRVNVDLKDGVVTLYGSVQTRRQANAAHYAAASFPGVKTVQTRLNVLT